MTGIRSTGPRDFPRIAKDMGFSFSLRRGRVDWHRIGTLDVDRLVQDRDLVTLQENLISVINYNLDSEYDVKILDSNFVKLFKLAQLSIDYLMYSEQHLYNCIELDQEQLQKFIKEIEKLKKENRRKDNEIKQLKKKLRATHDKRTEGHWHQHYRFNSGDNISNFYQLSIKHAGCFRTCKQCTHCGKKFLTAAFLEGHHGRRHPGVMFSMSLDPVLSETERLQSEIKELKERLNSTERLLQRESGHDVKIIAEPATGHGDEQKNGDMRKWKEEEKRKLEAWQEAQQRKYSDEIAELKAVFYNEIKRLKEPPVNKETSPMKAELLEQIHKQDEEIANLRERVSGQLTPDLENVQGRLEAQERFWKSQLKQIEIQHTKEIEELSIQLNQAKEVQARTLNSEYEEKIDQLLAHIAKQDEALKAQAQQILHLTTIQTQQGTKEPMPVKSPRPPKESASNKNIQSDAAVKFAELAARIDSAIHTSKKISEQSNLTKKQNKPVITTNVQSIESPEPTPQQTKKIPEKTVSPTGNSSNSHSPKQIITIPDSPKKPADIEPIVPSKPNITTKIITTEELSSSESSAQTQNEPPTMYGHINKKISNQHKLPEKAWSDKVSSLQGSKDSGLDSPKRPKSVPVTKVVKMTSLYKPVPVTSVSVSQDKVDSVVESESEDEDDDEEEEEIDVEVEDDVEEEETITEVEEEEEEEESETETDGRNELAGRSIHSLEDALQQNPQILKELKEDLRELLARRLRELGIDPEWKGIPAGTFKQKIATLKHHQNITAKRHKSFFRIKAKILEDLDKRVAERQKKTPSSKGKKSKEGPPQNKIAVKKLVGKVKTKALSVLKRSTNKDVRAVTGTLSTQPTKSQHKTANQETTTTVKSTKMTKPSQKRTAPVTKPAERKPSKTTRSQFRSTEKVPAEKLKVTIVTSTPKKPVAIPVASPRGSILKGSKTPSTSEPINISKVKKSSSSEEDDNEDEDEVPIATTIIQATTHSIVHSQPIKQIQSATSSTGSSQVTTPRNQDFLSDVLTDQDSPRGSKSALKSSSSMGSLTKKKVLFADQGHDSDDSPQRKTLSKPWNVSKVLHTTRLSRSSEALALKPSPSWDSSPIRSPAKSVTFAGKSEGETSDKTSDSDSDWRVSSAHDNLAEALNDIEDVEVSKTGSYERIHLSTKQSPKIAQISKDIEAQLKQARAKPPTGGVEAMFRASGSSASEKQGTSSSVGSLLSDNQENNINVANTAAPTPQPCTQQQANKLPLSDWDLEDLTD